MNYRDIGEDIFNRVLQDRKGFGDNDIDDDIIEEIYTELGETAYKIVLR